MKHQIELILNSSPEVLERVLRVVRHRGFTVATMNVEQQASRDTLLNMVVQSERAVPLLVNQLTKLIDVKTCQVL
ncbi:acetolactate synthase 2 small subunit [Shewanella marina]|uniref:acetolactate synthase 2 small subunit n=1 Tax=Shewanella marina TaxID=487319 RepID=UPI00055EEB6E|nr:acetolactate synthase 2 small subunit [Shewanella marina]